MREQILFPVELNSTVMEQHLRTLLNRMFLTYKSFEQVLCYLQAKVMSRCININNIRDIFGG